MMNSSLEMRHCNIAIKRSWECKQAEPALSLKLSLRLTILYRYLLRKTMKTLLQTEGQFYKTYMKRSGNNESANDNMGS